MNIGELAKAAHCTVQAIRYYERVGLMPVPGRSAGNFRQYDEAHLERLRFIRRCREMELDQGAVRTMLALMREPDQQCDVVNGLVDVHLEHIDKKISHLIQLRKELAGYRRSCGVSRRVDACAILGSIRSAREPMEASNDACNGSPAHTEIWVVDHGSAD